MYQYLWLDFARRSPGRYGQHVKLMILEHRVSELCQSHLETVASEESDRRNMRFQAKRLKTLHVTDDVLPSTCMRVWANKLR